LSEIEKEFGGIPAQDTKVGERQYFAVESYIENYVDMARDQNNRPIGEMGFMPFSRTPYAVERPGPTKTNQV